MSKTIADMIAEELAIVELVDELATDLLAQTAMFQMLQVATCQCGWYGGSKYGAPQQCSECSRRLTYE